MADGLLDEPKVVDAPKDAPKAADTPQEAPKDQPKDAPKQDDWRQQLAGGDEKELARLARFASPGDVYKSYRALEQRLSTGELKANKPFPEKGTPDEQNAWRKEQGIPEAPDKYDLKLDGIAIGEEDKPLISTFLKEAHAAHMPPAHAKAAVAAYYKLRDEQVKAAQEAEAQKIKDTEDALRVEWGQDYRKNLSVIDSLLDASVSSQSEMKGLIKNAAKGNAEFAKLLAKWALEINPSATVVAAGGANMASSIDDELAAIAEKRKKDPKAYFKDEKMLARERELLTARERVQARK